MAMLPVLNFHEICLRLRGYKWQVIVIIWYLDKDENIFIFEIEFLFFVNFRYKIEKFYNYFIRKC